MASTASAPFVRRCIARSCRRVGWVGDRSGTSRFASSRRVDPDVVLTGPRARPDRAVLRPRGRRAGPRQARSATSAASCSGGSTAPSATQRRLVPSARPTRPWASWRRSAAVSPSTSMRVAIASAMAPSTWATWAANSSSRRVPPPKRTRNAASFVGDEPEVGDEAELDLLVRRAGGGGGLRDGVEQLAADVGEHFAVEVPLRAEVLVEDRVWSPPRPPPRRSSRSGGSPAPRRPRAPPRAAAARRRAAGRRAAGGRDGHPEERRRRDRAGDRPARAETQGVRPPQQTPAATSRRPGRALPARPGAPTAASPSSQRRPAAGASRSVGVGDEASCHFA